MADNKNMPVTSQANTQSSIKHELTYDDKVIEKIVGIATRDIPGILTVSGGLLSGLNSKLHVTDQTSSGIDAEVGKKQVALDLNVVCEYGKYMPETFDNAIGKIASAVKDMTGLDVIEINMHVQDVLSSEDFRTMQQEQEQSVKENLGIGQNDDQKNAQGQKNQYQQSNFQTRVQ